MPFKAEVMCLSAEVELSPSSAAQVFNEDLLVEVIQVLKLRMPGDIEVSVILQIAGGGEVGVLITGLESAEQLQSAGGDDHISGGPAEVESVDLSLAQLTGELHPHLLFCQTSTLHSHVTRQVAL